MAENLALSESSSKAREAEGKSSQTESTTAAPANDTPGSSEQDEDALKIYPKGVELILITAALTLATFLAGLEANIVSTAIPTITNYFNALDDVGWYGSAYLLTTCSTQLFYGRLYTFFSVKWVFVSSVMVLFLGSFVSGIAPTSTALIVGRAIAGAGCAGIISGSLM